MQDLVAASEGADYAHDNEPIITARPSPEIGLRRSSRRNKGQYASTRYINEVFLSAVDQIGSLDEYHNALLYQAELETDMAAFESEITDPRVYHPLKFIYFAKWVDCRRGHGRWYGFDSWY